MWPTGEATSSTSLESSPNLPDRALQQAISEFEVCMTPLGSPVVPEVNISTAMSSGRKPGGSSSGSDDSSIRSKLASPSPSTTITCFR